MKMISPSSGVDVFDGSVETKGKFKWGMKFQIYCLSCQIETHSPINLVVNKMAKLEFPIESLLSRTKFGCKIEYVPDRSIHSL